MARKPKSTAAETLPAVNAAALHEDIAAVQSVTAADAAVIDSSEIMQQVGRIQGLEFTRRVVDVAIAQVFDEIKKSKKYNDLPYKDAKGNTRHVGDLEEFCRVFLKKSYNRCLELSQNLHLLGADLYEQAEQIGFRARDYQALKALPPAEQDIIKQAIEAQDKDAVIDLMQEMAVKHAGERAAQHKELDEARAEQRALDKLAAETAADKRDLKLQLEKLQLRTAPWDEKVAPFKVEITERQTILDEAIVRHQQAIQALDAWLNQELLAQPDYDPEAVAPLPAPVLTVLLHLDDAVQRTATLVGAAQHELRARFGDDIDAARQYLLQAPDAAEQ